MGNKTTAAAQSTILFIIFNYQNQTNYKVLKMGQLINTHYLLHKHYQEIFYIININCYSKKTQGCFSVNSYSIHPSNPTAPSTVIIYEHPPCDWHEPFLKRSILVSFSFSYSKSYPSHLTVLSKQQLLLMLKDYS